jgi:hypothetical protein
MLEMGIHAIWIGANDKHREGTMVWVSDKITSVKGLVTGIRENPIIQEVRSIVFNYGMTTATNGTMLTAQEN